jgi:hypothetical protein
MVPTSAFSASRTICCAGQWGSKADGLECGHFARWIYLEFRNPTSEIRKKFEIRNPNTAIEALIPSQVQSPPSFVVNFVVNAGYFFDLRPSDFFWISDFAPSEFPSPVLTHFQSQPEKDVLPQQRLHFLQNQTGSGGSLSLQATGQ